jgi:hypothetical protein
MLYTDLNQHPSLNEPLVTDQHPLMMKPESSIAPLNDKKNAPVHRLDRRHEQVHQRALQACAEFRRCEADLMTALEAVEDQKVHLRMGYSSLFQYAVAELKLSEHVIYALITVMRKSKEVPELKNKIRDGEITLGNAKRVSAVMHSENSTEWLQKAATLTQRQLEKEVVKVRPLSAVQERTSYVTESRIKLEVGLSETQMLRLRKAQDLVCQSSAKHASLEDTLVALTEFYLRHRDPVSKAKRVIVKKGSSPKAKPKAMSKPMPMPMPMKKDTSKVTQSTKQKQAGALRSDSSSNTNLSTSLETSSPALNSVGSIPIPISIPVHHREPIPAAILHVINLRDQRKCTFINALGRPCGQTRWVEVHHIKPVSRGGKNTPDNLITLCSGHHRLLHAK